MGRAAVQPLLRRRHQSERHRVDAPTLVRRRRVALAGEHVPEVAVAAGAARLHPAHAQRAVLDQPHRVGLGRLVERRPPAVALELRVRPEQLLPAGPAAVDADGLGVDVLAGERPLGAGLAQHVVLLRGQLAPPLLLGLGHLSGRVSHGPNGTSVSAGAPAVEGLRGMTVRLRRCLWCPPGTRVSVGADPEPRSAAMELDPKENALVLIEYQNDFTSDGGVLHGAVADVMASTGMLANTAGLIKNARDAGATIIHAPIQFAPGYNEISSHPYGILAGVVDSNAF